MKKLGRDHAIVTWICCVHPEVKKDVKRRFEKSRHGKAVEQIITKLYAHKVDADIPEIVNIFCKEWKQFVNEKGLYKKRNMWNVKDAGRAILQNGMSCIS